VVRQDEVQQLGAFAARVGREGDRKQSQRAEELDLGPALGEVRLGRQLTGAVLICLAGAVLTRSLTSSDRF
jgi:hypothetical protein